MTHHIALIDLGIILAANLPDEPDKNTYKKTNALDLYYHLKDEYETAIQHALTTSPLFKDQELAGQLFASLPHYEYGNEFINDPLTKEVYGGKFYPIDLGNYDVKELCPCEESRLESIAVMCFVCEGKKVILTKKIEPAEEHDCTDYAKINCRCPKGVCRYNSNQSRIKPSVESTEGESQLLDAIKKIHEMSEYNSNHDEILYSFQAIHKLTTEILTRNQF